MATLTATTIAKTVASKRYFNMPFATSSTTKLFIAIWLLPLLLLAMQQQPAECRYLPTRSHGDDLDKLRELMLQILESSNEEQQRPPNEANGNTLSSHPRAGAGAWLGKMTPMDGGMDMMSRKYGSGGSRGIYENGHYY